MSRHVASVGAGGSGGAHFQLRTTKIVDRNKPGIKNSRRPFPQSAPIAGAMRRTTKALLFAPINAQAEWATAPDTRCLTFRSHRAAPRSTPRRKYVLVGSMSASRASAPRAMILPAARDRAAPLGGRAHLFLVWSKPAAHQGFREPSRNPDHLRCPGLHTACPQATCQGVSVNSTNAGCDIGGSQPSAVPAVKGERPLWVR